MNVKTTLINLLKITHNVYFGIVIDVSIKTQNPLVLAVHTLCFEDGQLIFEREIRRYRFGFVRITSDFPKCYLSADIHLKKKIAALFIKHYILLYYCMDFRWIRGFIYSRSTIFLEAQPSGRLFRRK